MSQDSNNAIEDSPQYSEYLSWKSHPTTHLAVTYLQKMRSFYLDRLLVGDLNDVAISAKCAGIVQTIDALLSLTFEDLTAKEAF